MQLGMGNDTLCQSLLPCLGCLQHDVFALLLPSLKVFQTFLHQADPKLSPGCMPRRGRPQGARTDSAITIMM